MTVTEVRKLAGPPAKVARQVLHGHYHEVWLYEKPEPLYVEFDCRRGHEPRVINVQPASKPRP